MSDNHDRYDPTGEAAIWKAASQLVTELKNDALSVDWNAALDQASRALDAEARGIRQRVGGMYYRQISGNNHQSLPE